MLIKIKATADLDLLEDLYHDLEQQGRRVTDDPRDYVIWVMDGRPRDITLLSLKYPHLEIAQVGL